MKKVIRTILASILFCAPFNCIKAQNSYPENLSLSDSSCSIIIYGIGAKEPTHIFEHSPIVLSPELKRVFLNIMNTYRPSRIGITVPGKNSVFAYIDMDGKILKLRIAGSAITDNTNKRVYKIKKKIHQKWLYCLMETINETGTIDEQKLNKIINSE